MVSKFKANTINKKVTVFVIIAVLIFSAFAPYVFGLNNKAKAETQSVSAYVTNTGKLTEESFITLPLGTVKPLGWLYDQLMLQADGITGEMELYDNYTSKNGWLGGNGDAWEKGPYYVRGALALGYTLGNKELKVNVQKWIDWALNSQDSDGNFGPKANTDWWARMPMLMAIRDYYEATEALGSEDARVMPFFDKYFKYQLNKLPSNPLFDWAQARAGDNMEVAYWYYNKIFDESNPQESDWVLELTNLLYSQATKWAQDFHTTTVRQHVVNTTQAWKTPALLFSQLTNEQDREQARTALESALLNIGIDHGRIDGLPNADEAARDNKATRGTELCAMAEGIISLGLVSDVLDEAWVGDLMERIAYNALPAAYAPDYLGHVYYISQNQIAATPGSHEFEQDHGDDLAFGAPTGFECCFPNNHVAWPKFVQNMWKATQDNGLAIVAYGPNTVSAKVGVGKTAKFIQETTYPFDEQIVLNYSGETAQFPLKLRIPEWCGAAVIKVNGKEQSGAAVGGYFTVDRTFRSGDTVEISFPMEIRTSSWYKDTVGVERGPLIYSIKVEEQWANSDSANRGTGQEPKGKMKFREVTPASAWNYGLVIDEDDLQGSFDVDKRGVTTNQPFDVDGAPVVIKAKGQILPQWKMENNIVSNLSYGAIEYDEAMVEDIELMPYACGRLRISQIPKIGEYSDTVIRTKSTDFERKVFNYNTDLYDYVNVQEFDNLMVNEAENYTLKLNYEGSGDITLKLNNLYTQELSCPEKGSAAQRVIEIGNLKNLISNTSFEFNSIHYNNLRFYDMSNSGVRISKIEVVPVNVSVNENIRVSAIGGNKSFTVTAAKLGRDSAPYSVMYGLSAANLDIAASGFRTEKAVITGLEAGTYYYSVQAVIGGKTVKTQARAVAVTDNSTALPGVPNAKDVNIQSFSGNILYSFDTYGNQSKIKYADNKLVLQADVNVKATVKDSVGTNWTDYVVETSLNATSGGGNGGLIFRVSDVSGGGADSVTGYYYGIDTHDVVIGYMNNSFTEIIRISGAANGGGIKNLKVISKGKQLMFIMNGEVIFACEDDKSAAGGVGFRSYERTLEVSNLTVRGLNSSDDQLLDKGYNMEVDAKRSYGMVQLKYKRMGNVSYKVMYGTESGVYTDVVYDIKANLGYVTDRLCISGLDNCKTYYMKVVAINANGDMCSSAELALSPYDEKDISVRALTITGYNTDRILKTGDKLDLDVNFNPVASQRDVIWESSDSSILEIDTDGNLTAKSDGIVTVTVKSATSLTDSDLQTCSVKFMVKEDSAVEEVNSVFPNWAVAIISIAATMVVASGAVCLYLFVIRKKVK